MKVFSAAKELSALPDPLVADTVYAVRVGAGFDLYITDSTGLIAYKINMPESAGTPPFAATIGDGSTNPIVVTHNLGTRNVEVVLRAHAAPYDRQYCRWEATDANTATLYFDTAPASDALDVLVSTLAQGAKGDKGDTGAAGGVQSIVAGANVSVDNTDPANPVVSATGGGSGGSGTGLVGSRYVTADYTLTADDNGREIQVDSPTLQTVTFAPGVLPVPFECSVRQVGSGSVRVFADPEPAVGDALIVLIVSPSSSMPSKDTTASQYTGTPRPALTQQFTKAVSVPTAANFACFSRIIDGTEPTLFLQGDEPKSYAVIALLASGVDPTTPIDAHVESVQASVVSGDGSIVMGAPAVTVSRDGGAAVFWATGVTTGEYNTMPSWTIPDTFIRPERVAQVNTNINLLATIREGLSAGAAGAAASTQTFVYNGSGSTGFVAGQIALKAAAGKQVKVKAILSGLSSQSANVWICPISPAAAIRCVGAPRTSARGAALRVRCVDGWQGFVDGEAASL